MKIRRVWLRDVGPFGQLDLRLLPGTIPDRADVVVVTGPNGSGKSTLLRAIASLLDDGDDHLRGRASVPPAQVAVEIEVQGTTNLIGRGLDVDETGALVSPTGELFDAFERREVSPAALQVAGPSAMAVSNPYARTGEQALRTGPVFVFGASRAVARPGTLSVVDDDAPPLPHHGSFDAPPRPGQLEQWVAVTRTKLALARDEGNHAEAARYERAIRVFEQAVTDLIGETFTVRVIREPFAVVGVVNGFETPLHLLPDGLQSALAWLGDVLRRLDRMERPSGLDVLALPIIVLLDEIDAHLHPAWQRRILYVAERLLPNAQLICTTHSPFVVQSATDACIVKLGEHGRTCEVIGPQSARTIDTVLDDILGMSGSQYSIEIEREISAFKNLRDRVLVGASNIQDLEEEAFTLAARDESLDLAVARVMEDTRHRISQ